jgi:hypothetical protein
MTDTHFNVGDMFVWDDLKIIIIEIKGFSHKVHIYGPERDYEHIYEEIQVKAMMDKRNGWTYYPVVK